MDINDYIIDHEEIDWKDILSDWFWLLPSEFTPWLVNRFGDIFLVYPDETVYIFDTGAGTLTHIANDRDHFCELIDLGDNANIWLMIPLINKLKNSGNVLKENECYSFIIPPGLGGKYETENVKVYDLSVHYSVTGQVFEKIKDFPDGSKVNFTVT